MGRTAQTRALTTMTSEIDHLDVIVQHEQWVVTYQGELVGLCSRRLSKAPKYQRTVFATQKPAQNLADRLNLLFNTQDFGSARLSTVSITPTPVIEALESRPKQSKQRHATRASNVDRTTMRKTPAGHIIYTDTKTGRENIKLNVRKKLE